ncbi:MAG: transcription repressor NadR [Alkalibacterium sp.]|nr:transcription repressor NadR [Alkalibacterium sp.]TVP90074.1 MAG: transcription repressor NadR [Alkalibacterium sp.]
MEAEERRQAIIELLSESDEAIVARALASTFNVSRQVIVGDIALLRAAGEDIVSTPKGYLKQSTTDKGVSRSIVCQHVPEDTRDELYTVVDLGGEIVDVTVEHPVYGLIQGNLMISSRLEADEFIAEIEKNPSALLSTLTNGLHTHTIKAQSAERIDKIVEALKEKGFIYN